MKGSCNAKYGNLSGIFHYFNTSLLELFELVELNI